MRKLIFVLGALVLLVLIVTLTCLAKKQKTKKEVAHYAYAAITPQPLLIAKPFSRPSSDLLVPTRSAYYVNKYNPRVRAQCRSET